MFQLFIRNLLDLLFPPFCCGCNALGTYLCWHCLDHLEIFDQKMKLKLEPSYLDEVYFVSNYRFPLNRLIKIMKYDGVKDIAPICARLIFNLVDFPDADFISYVPLHKNRQLERGFNQAHSIAEHLSQLSGVRLAHLLIRTRDTPHQAGLADKELRAKNLESSFQVREELRKKAAILNGKTILLLDDVVTTSVTLNLCAKELKKIGVNQVIGLAVAHG